MGLTKADLFTAEQNELAAMAKVLAHPARIAILHHLIKANACINSDLVAELGLAQATISQHLKELKVMDLICGTIEGVSMSYCINETKWASFKHKLESLFNNYNPKCCTSKEC